MATVINGRELADKMQTAFQKEVEKLSETGVIPGLVVILVGDNPASQIYVRNKERTAKKIGINSVIERMPKTTSQEELLARIEYYNNSPEFHGILVQLPLPEHIDEERVLLAINPEKDVDGFHPMNIGKLYMGEPDKIPCTPYGIMKMFEEYNIDLAGKKAVVVGRSNIVGKPMAQLMLMKDATVTIVHSKTVDLASVTREADILVVAIGVAEFITADHVKNGACVIDVGMNRDENGKLFGDVSYDEVAKKASFITPVPGGVGPMTITMLMEQTIANAKKGD